MKAENTLRYLTVFGVFLIPFVPLLISTFMYFPFITGKAFTFQIISEIVFFLWLLLIVVDSRYRPKFSPILVSVLSLLVIMGFSTIFSENPSRSFWSNFERMDGYITLLHLGAYFLVIGSLFKTKEIWRRFFHLSIGVSVFVTLFALLQYSGALDINQGGIRVDATFGNAIYLAVYLLFHVFFLAFFWLREKADRISGSDISKYSMIAGSGIVGFSLFIVFYLVRLSWGDKLGIWGAVLALVSLVGLYISVVNFTRGNRLSNLYHNLSYGIFVFLELVIIILTATRGTVLGILGSAFVTAILCVVLNRGYRKAGLATLLAVVIVVGGFFAIKDTNLIKSSPVLSRFSSISISDGDAKARFSAWNIGIQAFKENPILGWGQNNFILGFGKYYDPKLFGREPWFDRSHNIVVDWLVSGGILGFLGYVSLIFSVLYLIWKRESDEGIQNFSFEEKGVLTALVIAYIGHNMFAFDQVVSYLFFFTFLAFIHSVKTSNEEVKEVTEENSKKEKLFNYVVPVLAILLAASLYQFSVRPMISAHYLTLAKRDYKEGPEKNFEYFSKSIKLDTLGKLEAIEQLSTYAKSISKTRAPNELKDKYYNFAYTELKDYIDKNPEETRIKVFFVSLLNTYGRYSESLPYLEDAHKQAPKKQDILMELGNSYLNMSKPKEGIEYFKQAFELGTKNENTAISYAAALIYGGMDSEAEDILNSFFGTILVTDERLGDAYFSRGNYDRLVEIWSKGVKDNPKNGRFHLLLGGAYAAKGDLEKSEEIVKKGIEVDPSIKDEGEYYLKALEQAKNK